MKALGLIAVVCSVLAMCQVPGHSQSSDLRERFVAEAPKAWETYRQRAKRLQGSILLVTEIRQPYHEVTRLAYELKQAQNCMLFLEQEFEPDTGGRPGIEYSKGGMVDVTNTLYTFDLRRSTAQAPWTIASVDTSAGHAAKYSARERLERRLTMPVVLGYWALAGKPPAPGVAGFEIKSVAPERRDGDELAKVEFEYRPVGEPSYRTPELFEGSVVLDPANYWIIREDDVRTSLPNRGPISNKRTYEYKQAEGFPIPTRIIDRQALPDSTFIEYKYDFDLRLADVPEGEFTLSAFGFSEPLERPGTTPWFFIVGLLGVALVVMAGLLRMKPWRRKN